MRFTIISVGKVKDSNILSLIDEYAKRIKIDFIEIKDSNKVEESKKIMDVLDKKRDAFTFILSEEGKELGSVELSVKIKKIEQQIVFVIGGPDGLIDEVKKKADFLLSLSRMTFTHEMAKLFLVEQLFRAISIIEGKKYHRL